MAASYPAGFDTMSDPSANLSGPPLHSTMHNQINDVIEAIEAELGINPSGSFVTVAAYLATLPWGEVAYAEAVGAQSGFGPGITDITGATVTFTATVTRKYEIKGVASINNAAAGTVMLTLADSANVQLQASSNTQIAAGYSPLTILKRVSGITGSKTYKLRASVNTGLLTMNQAVTVPTIISVTDVGPV